MKKEIIIGIVIGIVLVTFVFSLYSFTGNIIIETADDSCTDSDNGKDFTIKGTVVNEKGTTYSDYCINTKKLKEYYCGKEGTIFEDNIRKIRTTCKCEDGICVE